ncbi:MAG TPA: Cu(I)-responsive transcriptional regulator [Stellaceae bacterium]|nr:Cu(I)-responsive transcriptional regulator [Stellaceae bacterium]
MEANQPRSLNIGSVAEATGLPAKTIRYYESIGLVAPARRTGGNYRLYEARDVTTLRFIERARRLGFSLKEVAELLTLWRDRHRASADVRRLAEAQIRRVDARLLELKDMRRSLRHLLERCHGDDRPECPILEELAGPRFG